MTASEAQPQQQHQPQQTNYAAELQACDALLAQIETLRHETIATCEAWAQHAHHNNSNKTAAAAASHNRTPTLNGTRHSVSSQQQQQQQRTSTNNTQTTATTNGTIVNTKPARQFTPSHLALIDKLHRQHVKLSAIWHCISQWHGSPAWQRSEFAFQHQITVVQAELQLASLNSTANHALQLTSCELRSIEQRLDALHTSSSSADVDDDERWQCEVERRLLQFQLNHTPAAVAASAPSHDAPMQCIRRALMYATFHSHLHHHESLNSQQQQSNTKQQQLGDGDALPPASVPLVSESLAAEWMPRFQLLVDESTHRCIGVHCTIRAFEMQVLVTFRYDDKLHQNKVNADADAMTDDSSSNQSTPIVPRIDSVSCAHLTLDPLLRSSFSLPSSVESMRRLTALASAYAERCESHPFQTSSTASLHLPLGEVLAWIATRPQSDVADASD